MKDEIVINGIIYIPKEKKIQADHVLVRTYSAGVHIGKLVKKEKDEVILRDARRLWYWDGAASLSQLAMEGVSKPENCKFPCEVTEITLLGCIEIIPCTEEAILSLDKVKIWEV